MNMQLNTQKILGIVTIAAVLIVGIIVIMRQPPASGPIPTPIPTSTPPSPPTTTPPTPPPITTSTETGMIRVTSPLPNQLVTSPLTIQGEARGTWYFEASFPVKLLDANGRQLAIIPAQAQGDWMTQAFVPFNVTLRYATPTTATGTLVLEKDNPSGLPEHAAEYRIPVRFGDYAPATSTTSSTRAIKLFFYNSEKDKDALGNILCSAQGVVAVKRTIPRTLTPIRDAIQELLNGKLTQAERAQGLETEFPLPGLELKLASLTNGVLSLTFNDPQNKTTGGSCRVSVLWAQIEATAMQFEGVKSVKFLPETLFQP